MAGAGGRRGPGGEEPAESGRINVCMRRINGVAPGQAKGGEEEGSKSQRTRKICSGYTVLCHILEPQTNADRGQAGREADIHAHTRCDDITN